METGKLTPKSNNTVDAMRFSGCFDQPDGFGSVLDVTVNTAGDAALTLTYKRMDNKEHTWTIMLNSSQRNALATMLALYQPIEFEQYITGGNDV